MGKGGQKQNGLSRTFTWDDVRSHDKKDDRWVVIDGEIYDVTKWSRKHPGGSRLITHYVGQDASEAFLNFHNDLDKSRKYLKAMHVGTVEEYTDLDIHKDFRELKETVTKLGYFKPSVVFFSLVFAHVILLEALAYLAMVYFGAGWIPFSLTILLFSASQVQNAWFQHDVGHLSVFDSTRLNHLTHMLTMGFIMGGTPTWWNHMHYQHHSKPNVINKDPDVRIDQLFVVGDEMPVKVANSRKSSMPFNLQQFYFFLVFPPLLFPVYFQYTILRHVVIRKNYVEMLMIVLFFAKLFYLYVPLIGVGWTIALFFIVRCMTSMWFVWVSQSNHIPMTIREDKENPWLKLQLYATCNIEKSYFNDWFTGHLNFQIEHHLFPTMPRHNLYKAAPLVKSLCKKHGVPYIVKSMSTAYADIVRTLKQSGKLWEEAYRQAHHVK